MKTYEDKDESLFRTAVIMITAVISIPFIRSEDASPSPKPRSKRATWLDWLSPAPGPGAGHNPS